MGRVITSAIGGALMIVGAISLVGAFELVGTGATTEALAQGFLVPISLFIVGAFVIWMGWQSGRP